MVDDISVVMGKSCISAGSNVAHFAKMRKTTTHSSHKSVINPTAKSRFNSQCFIRAASAPMQSRHITWCITSFDSDNASATRNSTRTKRRALTKRQKERTRQKETANICGGRTGYRVYEDPITDTTPTFLGQRLPRNPKERRCCDTNPSLLTEMSMLGEF